MDIYIVFSATPYRMGRFIRCVTKEPYNHVSIALDRELTQMYSFARRHYRTPFYGGFVKESLSRYHIHGKSANIRVCRLTVTEQQHAELSSFFNQMLTQSQEYLYNHFSAAFTVLRKPVRLKKAYTCVEFCVQVLYSLGLGFDPRTFHTVGDLEKALSHLCIYNGPAPEPADYDEAFYAEHAIPHPTRATVGAIAKLFTRF